MKFKLSHLKKTMVYIQGTEPFIEQTDKVPSHAKLTKRHERGVCLKITVIHQSKGSTLMQELSTFTMYPEHFKYRFTFACGIASGLMRLYLDISVVVNTDQFGEAHVSI